MKFIKSFLASFTVGLSLLSPLLALRGILKPERGDFMSYFQSDVQAVVTDALRNIKYSGVSELSKEEFEKLLSTALYSVLTSRNFERHIKDITK
jgi:hypothetical protein